jgi:hypothetical protein
MFQRIDDVNDEGNWKDLPASTNLFSRKVAQEKRYNDTSPLSFAYLFID